MTNAPKTSTKPAAGVIPTKPATAPDIAPNIVGFPIFVTSIIVQTMRPVAAATFDTIIAFAARPLAARPDPPLNPIQPNQSSAAPSTAYPKLCGINEVFFLLPKTNATARAEIPELMWTTAPPAKSSAPICISHPPPHTQWAIGT